MRNEILINKMINQLKTDGINHITETTSGCSNIIFTNSKGSKYIFAISILERLSGNQACLYFEEGEGKNKTLRIETLTDELYYDRMKSTIKYVLK